MRVNKEKGAGLSLLLSLFFLLWLSGSPTFLLAQPGEDFWRAEHVVVDSYGNEVGRVKASNIELRGSSVPSADSPENLIDGVSRNTGAGGLSTASNRPQNFSPDRNTAFDGNLHYEGVFRPSIRPYKRMSVFDSIRDGKSFALERSTETLEVLDVGNKSRSEIFWGDVMLDFSSQNELPLPSVGPSSRILSYESEARRELIFKRDNLGNYSVSQERPRRGTLRLRFAMDVDPDYFAPRNFRESFDQRTQWLLPPRLREEGKLFAAEIGIGPELSFRDALNALIYYFRSFVEGEGHLSEQNSIYLDIARSQKGVCRHRSFAFLVTALAIGIPARFVHNEVHAFVEVEHRKGHWSLIDLGGALDENTPASSVGAHTFEDAFPRPESFQKEQNRSAASSDTKQDTKLDVHPNPVHAGQGIWLSSPALERDRLLGIYLTHENEKSILLDIVEVPKGKRLGSGVKMPIYLKHTNYEIEMREISRQSDLLIH